MAQQTTQHNAEDQRTKYDSDEPLGRVIEIIGSSNESFDDAIRSAVSRASKTMRHITGIEVENMTCKIRENEIAEYRVDMRLAFGVEPKKD